MKNKEKEPEKIIISKDKVIEAKDRTIARLKRKVMSLRKHLSAFGVGKKRIWEYK
jgi:hypothetical protein